MVEPVAVGRHKYNGTGGVIFIDVNRGKGGKGTAVVKYY